MEEENLLESKVPQLCQERGWDIHQFRSKCVAVQLSVHTADRIFEGGVSVNLNTLAIVTHHIFGLQSIADVIDLKNAKGAHS